MPRRGKWSTLQLPILTEQEVQRFWGKVDIRGPSDCWPWLAAHRKDGGGFFAVKRITYVTSRIAFFLASGIDPGNLLVCHSCDNPPCCNSAHLFVGTHLDNELDSIAKGRARRATGVAHGAYTHPERRVRGDRNGMRIHPESRKYGDEHWTRKHPEWVVRGDAHPARIPGARVGSKNGRSRLTEETVLEIRKQWSNGVTHRELVRLFNVPHGTMGNIIHRFSWRHI